MSLLKDSKPQNGFPYYAFRFQGSAQQNFLRPYLLLFPNKLERISLPFTSTLVSYLQARLEPTRVNPLVGLHPHNLACKYKTREGVNGRGKHSSLLRYSNNYDRKKFYGRSHRCFSRKSIGRETFGRHIVDTANTLTFGQLTFCRSNVLLISKEYLTQQWLGWQISYLQCVAQMSVGRMVFDQKT
jgi:hypothetical protein